MRDLGAATQVDQTGPSTFSATLSPDWEIWGPNGGYVAAVALRAAGAMTGRDRPVSINAHFVGVGGSQQTDIDVVVNRVTRVATSVSVNLSQGGKTVLVATVWGADGALAGLEHQVRSATVDLPGPEELPSVRELMAHRGPMPHPFWGNVDQRPLSWIADWDGRTSPSEPSTESWYRFVPTDVFADPWIDACRSLILLDLDSWGAAGLAHLGELAYFAPTIEVTARFVGSTSNDPWLLSRADAPVARDGIIAASGEIWTPSGQLVATGGSTLLCRPAALRPDR
jgi:acyl-CoA thioesterase II